MCVSLRVTAALLDEFISRARAGYEAKDRLNQFILELEEGREQNDAGPASSSCAATTAPAPTTQSTSLRTDTTNTTLPSIKREPYAGAL